MATGRDGYFIGRKREKIDADQSVSATDQFGSIRTTPLQPNMLAVRCWLTHWSLKFPSTNPMAGMGHSSSAVRSFRRQTVGLGLGVAVRRGIILEDNYP